MYTDMPDPNPSPSIVRPPSNVAYLVAVAFMSLLVVIAVLLITFLRPDKDNSTLITLVIGSLVPTTGTILAFMKSQETHLSVNSRLDEFMKTAKVSAYDKGVRDANSTVGVAVAALMPSPLPIDKEKALADRIAHLESLIPTPAALPKALDVADRSGPKG